jgi:hypothetical protein
MSSNEIHPYNFPASQANDFERKGHPGKFLQSITCSSGTTTYFTGSNFGVGGLIVPASTTGTASLSKGGDIPLAVLAGSQRIFELSVTSVKVDTNGPVYALIKNQVSK